MSLTKRDKRAALAKKRLEASSKKKKAPKKEATSKLIESSE